jgi:hypothetical protein
VVVVANAMPVKRSVKAIANNIPCLFIVTNSLDKDLRILKLANVYIKEKTKKYLYPFIVSSWKGSLHSYQKGSIHRLLLFVKLGSLHRVPF